MDGAARFNQRDALATILITAINIIAGFLIGVFQLGIPFREALKTYTVLTVGDGLVTMIPSLLVSVAGGMVVTRPPRTTPWASTSGKQLLAAAGRLWIAAGVMLALALIPGLPKFSFLAHGGVGGGAGAARAKDELDEAGAGEAHRQRQSRQAAGQQESLEDLLKLDELEPRSRLRPGAAGGRQAGRATAGSG